LQPLKAQLAEHPLYGRVTSMQAIRVFMESHVYAVWDFMSLLKALQQQLTCTSVPWVPAADPAIARFVNEIVLAEESDIGADGQPLSHFEMYLSAMEQVGADTAKVGQLLKAVRAGADPLQSAQKLGLPAFVQQFLAHTFEVVQQGQPHEIAAAFTFGREDLIPDMFMEVVEQSRVPGQEQAYHKLTYYLNRHIELDGDEHGPLAHKMVMQLCGDDAEKWGAVERTSQKSLMVRLALWDGIAETLPAVHLV